VATNAGGPRGLKYGVTANHVLGLKLVLMDGEVVDLGGPYLEAPGYDLLALVIGSEGQFGIVTEATVRILRAADHTRRLALGFDAAAPAIACGAAIRESGPVAIAIEVLDRPAVEMRASISSSSRAAESVLLVTVEGAEPEVTAALERLKAIAKPFAPRSLQADSGPGDKWDACAGGLSDCLYLDGTVPLGRIAHALAEVTRICTRRRLRAAHTLDLGSGTIRSLLFHDPNEPKQVEQAELARTEILKACVEAGGCLSGEYGVGVEKRDLMPVQFTPTDLAVQMRTKTAFDRDWLLNPAKVFPLAARARQRPVV
jgi:glycolate oxidase